MAPVISLHLNPPYNNEFYSTNDTISGTATVSLDKSLSIKRISVVLKGFTETVTKIDPISLYNQNNMMTPVQDNKSYHTLVSASERVFPPDNVWYAIEGTSKPFKVKPGEYEYKFQFPKMPKKPKCLINHTSNLICFTKRADTKMPPSFNNQWRDLTKIDNLDLFYYANGKVIYTVQVQIELGKSTLWYKPFHKIIREIKPIEFIPQPADLLYDDEDDETEDDQGQSSSRCNSDPMLNGSADSSDQATNTSASSSTHEFNMNPLRLDNSVATLSLLPSDKLKKYKSSYRIGLPDGRSTMWIEVRSRRMRETYRNDFLFRNGSGKFDRVYLIMRGNMVEFNRARIFPVKIQFNLLETVTYLSQGVANENFSSLRLVEINNINSKLRSVIMDYSKIKVLTTEDKNAAEGKLECEINLKDHPILKKLKFNEEDYKHRGNRLYSFRTCSIKRIFNFQLVIEWDINGVLRQTENIIKPMQIFVQTGEPLTSDVLPKYVEPPLYSESLPTSFE